MSKTIIPGLGALPRVLRRKCCPGKSCGPVTVTLDILPHVSVEGDVVTVTYSLAYMRDNGDVYRSASTPEGLMSEMNSPWIMPGDENAE